MDTETRMDAHKASVFLILLDFTAFLYDHKPKHNLKKKDLNFSYANALCKQPWSFTIIGWIYFVFVKNHREVIEMETHKHKCYLLVILQSLWADRHYVYV